jgi:ADP-ribose pyrophosphatase
MVHQFRAAIRRETIELPAGTREPPEAAQACAERELAEEMGVRAATWRHLLDFYSSPGFCTEQLSVFVATDLSPAANVPEEDESIRREWIDLAAVPSLIASGELSDAKSIAGILAYILQVGQESARWQS